MCVHARGACSRSIAITIDLPSPVPICAMNVFGLNLPLEPEWLVRTCLPPPSPLPPAAPGMRFRISGDAFSMKHRAIIITVKACVWCGVSGGNFFSIMYLPY